MFHCWCRISLVLFFLYCVVSVLSRSVSVPKDDNKTHKKTYIEGQGVLVPCNITESPDVKVWWTKNESHSQFHQAGIVLRFNGVNRTDAGTYLCHAENITTDDNETVVDYVILNIEYPAEATYFFTSVNEVRENGTFTLSGKVVGNPDPVYELRNNDTGIGMFSANLHASFSIGPNPARCQDMGLYMITGHNKMNKGNFTKTAFVTVLCSPRPTYDNTYQVYSQLLGESRLVMKCLGYPYPEFKWFHFGKDVTHRSKKIDNHTTEIFIEKLALQDAGNYTLKMSNELGSYSAVYSIIPRGPPGKATLNIIEVLIHSVKLQWYTGYDYGRWARFHVMKLIGNQFMDVSLVEVYASSSGYQWVEKMVTGLTSNTSYRMIVVGENSNGLGGFSNEVHFRTMPSVAPSSNYDYSDEVNPLTWAVPLGIFILLVFFASLSGIVFHRRMKKINITYEDSSNNQEKKKIIN